MKTRLLLLALVATTLSAAVPEAIVPARQSGDSAVIRLEHPPFGAKQEAIQPTEVRLAYDANFLYITFLCADAEIIPAGEKHDDLLHRGDAVEIFIDGSGDHRQFYEIQLNPKGLARDVNYLFTGETLKLDAQGLYLDWGNVWDDANFNIPDLRVTAKTRQDGYEIECAIPAKALMRRRNRATLSPGDKLRANFVRFDSSKTSECVISNWSPTAFGRAHRSPGRMGFLILK